MPTFGTLFRNAFCSAAHAANWKASSENRRFLLKSATFVHLPGLRLCLSELCLCLLSCVCNGKAEQQRKGFRKCTSFLKTRTVLATSQLEHASLGMYGIYCTCPWARAIFSVHPSWSCSNYILEKLLAEFCTALQPTSHLWEMNRNLAFLLRLEWTMEFIFRPFHTIIYLYWQY